MRQWAKWAAGVVAFALVAVAAPLAWAERARGVVFEDRNGDGARQPGEPGLRGALVSNGVDVTETDGAGRYTLTAPTHGAIFVVQPPGFSVARDRTNTPRGYRLFRSAGAPQLDYPSPPPSSPLPPSLDFPLTRGGPGSRFTALLFADPQPTTDAELTFVRDDFLADAARHRVDFALGLGDLMNDDLALIPRYQDLMGTLSVPVWSVAGNHELNFRSPDDTHSLETYARFFGPARYAFMAGDAVFVVLDNVHYLGAGTSQMPNPRAIGAYRGELGAEQLRFVANLLERVPQDRLVVIAVHIPLKATWDGDNVNTADRDALIALLCNRRHALVLAGHMHNGDHRYFPCPEGSVRRDVHQHTLSTVSGSWWSGPMDARGIPVSMQTDGAPNGYYVLEVDGTAYRTRFFPQSEPADRQMRITLDTLFYRYSPWAMRDYAWGEIASRPITTDQLPAARVYVNLFDGGPKSQVFLRIGDRPEVTLEKVVENDPAAEELFFRAEGVRLNLTASPSTHLWRGPLPADLPAGVHVIEARAIDEFGAEHRARAFVEVLSPR
jgi:hypothetical protein